MSSIKDSIEINNLLIPILECVCNDYKGMVEVIQDKATFIEQIFLMKFMILKVSNFHKIRSAKDRHFDS